MGTKATRCLRILSTTLVLWSLVSLTWAGPLGARLYGAGTINDKCDFACYSDYKFFCECYHESPTDTCLTNKCIENWMVYARCDPNEAACQNNCQYVYSTSAFYLGRAARKPATCDSDDWSTGVYPIVDWGECEYNTHLGSGRCFATTPCWEGDYDWFEWYYGNYTCD